MLPAAAAAASSSWGRRPSPSSAAALKLLWRFRTDRPAADRAGGGMAEPWARAGTAAAGAPMSLGEESIWAGTAVATRASILAPLGTEARAPALPPDRAGNFPAAAAAATAASISAAGATAPASAAAAALIWRASSGPDCGREQRRRHDQHHQPGCPRTLDLGDDPRRLCRPRLTGAYAQAEAHAGLTRELCWSPLAAPLPTGERGRELCAAAFT